MSIFQVFIHSNLTQVSFTSYGRVFMIFIWKTRTLAMFQSRLYTSAVSTISIVFINQRCPVW